jgi:chitosanase
MNDLQKHTAQAIVNIFETGRVQGDYGSVVTARDDPGHLTYGRSQATLASGNLHRLIELYCRAGDAQFAAALAPYLHRLEARDTALDAETGLHGILRAAGGDRVMRAVQDAFFDEAFWRPALAAAAKIGVTTPLGTCVVYDGKVHGSFGRMRDRTDARHSGARSDEKAWIACYVAVRRAWLSGHANPLLQRTVYRMDAFQALIEAGAWDLPLPLNVRGRTIDETALGP